jgi:two-component system OmpR family sensor kinase
MIMMRNLVDNGPHAGGRHDRRVGGWGGAGEDSGPGIPEDERERVFDRFYRVAGSEVGGSGLGLAIIKAIAERHGATLTLGRSERLGGLMAVVAFPKAAGRTV